jgi:hypothetical protein
LDPGGISFAFHWASRIYRIIRIIFFATFQKKVAKSNPPAAKNKIKKKVFNKAKRLNTRILAVNKILYFPLIAEDFF